MAITKLFIKKFLSYLTVVDEREGFKSLLSLLILSTVDIRNGDNEWLIR